ncbi:MAG: HD domain-containing protein [Ruminococcaceae bacterium]|nr:HD domain-containing protein [Oscillospiraceae bacterium]
MHIPEEVLELMERLENAGHECWAVGGCVRDWKMGIQPHDYDCCTAAAPEQMQELFSDRQLVLAGLKHGTVGVVTKTGVVEITTFRTEGGYADSRHPDWVHFVRDLREDLARRDFTVNAMAYSPRRGLCDPFGGQADLKNGILRAVGDPDRRFREDALRILRGLRFAARFGFEIEEDTRRAMDDQIAGLDDLARERVLVELTGFLQAAGADDLVNAANILCRLIPELAPCVGFDQHSRHHVHDVFGHIATVVERVPAEPALRLAALLHDIGKPAVFSQDEKGEGHFYGHAAVSAELADAILHRLKASNALREEVLFLVKHHMDHYLPEEKTARRCLSRHGLARMERLIDLQAADLGGKGTDAPDESLQELAQLRTLLRSLAEKEGALTLKTLAVKGADLIAQGMSPGPELGRTLNGLLAKVLAGELPNDREELLAVAQRPE